MSANIKSKEQSASEQEGVDAFRRGMHESDCPYPKGKSTGFRAWWFNGFLSARTVQKFPKLFTLAELLTCMFLLVGCGPLTTPSDSANPNPAPTSNRDDIWSNLAECMKPDESGKPLVTNSTQLQLIVQHLRDQKKLTDSDVAACYRLFDGIEKKEIPLSPDDAAKLLTLPVKMVGGK